MHTRREGAVRPGQRRSALLWEGAPTCHTAGGISIMPTVGSEVELWLNHCFTGV